MLIRTGPVPNVERQRKFRERNPGYYGRLKARERAHLKAYIAGLKLAAIAQAEAARREPLMLPAPVEMLEIPGMNAIPLMMPSGDVAEAVSVRGAS